MNRQERRQASRDAAKGRPIDPAAEGVCLSWITGGRPEAPWVGSVADLLCYDARNGGRITNHGTIIWSNSSPRLAAGRNSLVREFIKLDPRIRWHFWLDDDMTFQPEVLERMIATAHELDAGIVGGLAFVGGRGSADIFPTMYVLADDPGAAAKLRLNRVERYPKGGVIGVDGTGAACMLVRRDVYERMYATFGRRPDGDVARNPWFADGEHMGEEYGEDVVFCLRARQCGVKIVVDTRCAFGHVKHHELTEGM